MTQYRLFVGRGVLRKAAGEEQKRQLCTHASASKKGGTMADTRKRIALFAGQADESYQSRFISGFLKEAFDAGYDVCIFSMYRKYQDTPEREQGESNIFSLMAPDRFDGAVILKDSNADTNYRG